jgi:hypothetical protein
MSEYVPSKIGEGLIRVTWSDRSILALWQSRIAGVRQLSFIEDLRELGPRLSREGSSALLAGRPWVLEVCAPFGERFEKQSKKAINLSQRLGDLG